MQRGYEVDMVGSMSRPSDLNDIRAQRIIECIRKGNTRRCAAKVVGIHPSTLQDWIAKGEAGHVRYAAFAERVARADGEMEEAMVDKLVQAALSGNWVAAKTWLELRKGAWRAKKPKEPPQQDLTKATDDELETAMRMWLDERKKVG
jgi:transposase